MDVSDEDVTFVSMALVVVVAVVVAVLIPLFTLGIRLTGGRLTVRLDDGGREIRF